jgi:hypothetical protein
MDYGITTQSKIIDNLFAGDFPKVSLPVTVVSGSGVLIRGTLLGKVTASGKYKPYNNANVDGSETAKLVLAEDIDATSADVKTTAFAAGEFNEAKLIGLDAAARVDFEPGTSPIFIKKVY